MNENSNSDDDYMSDKFITASSSSARPGLVFSRATKRRYEVEKRTKKAKIVPKSQEMDKKREEGLNTQINQDNVGFKLMIKMGFKGVGGLGKRAEGRSEPVPIEIVEGRKGLGLHNAQKKITQQVVAARKQRDTHMSAFQSDFRNSMAARFNMERSQRQLNAARSICQQLDLSRCFSNPVDDAFWPPDEPVAKLLAQSEVIRREICRSEERPSARKHRPRHDDNGIKAVTLLDGSDPLDEHRGEYNSVLGVESGEEEYCDIDAAQHGPVETRPDLLLERLSAYLRDTHFYCFWCGAQFGGSSDLLSNCPGPSEEDHG